MSIFIRAMRMTDAEDVACLSDELGYPTTTARIEERMALIGGLPDNALLVAESDGMVVGWVHVYGEHLLESEVSHAEVGGLVVSKDARRGGVGRALMHAAENWAAEHRYSTVRVRSGSERKEAHLFYQSLGYELLKTQLRFRKLLGR